MAGGGTLVDGVRRLFNRRNYVRTTASDSSHCSQSSAFTSSIAEEHSDEEDISESNLDTSALNHIRVPKRLHVKVSSSDSHKQTAVDGEFFTEYDEACRYEIQEVIGKGSYGVVASAIDTRTGNLVAIKKITDVFDHVSDATRILREIKLLRLLQHPNIVRIKHIMLPPSPREFRDIYVVFELMESDLHQVIKTNADLKPEHFRFFLYQMLRALKYIHAANVFHRDLKPRNVLANSDCKLKICDFGLARVAFNEAPSTIFWTDYVATRWYRAPELCGCFFSKYTPSVDIWSIGCIFAELLIGRPLFPGKNVVHQLDLITDLLGTPSPESISKIRNEKARRYLGNMRRKVAAPFSQKFPGADPPALRLLESLLAFDSTRRPTAEMALCDPYFHGLADADHEPGRAPISRLEFDFERRKLRKDDVRDLIYTEILEYHPKMLQVSLEGAQDTRFMYPSGVDRFRRQFAHLEEMGRRGSPLQMKYPSLPREKVLICAQRMEPRGLINDVDPYSGPTLLKSSSICASQSPEGHGKLNNPEEEDSGDGVKNE